MHSSPSGAPTYWLTRFCFLRALGFVYLAAYISLVWQYLPLLGEEGLLPVSLLMGQARRELGVMSFLRLPSFFWFTTSDTAAMAAAWTGLALSAALLAGFANAISLAILWFIYLSFCNTGQIFYGYGWEILLLETGFLAIFLMPPLQMAQFSRDHPPPRLVFLLLRWTLFRLMLGAGLIKLRSGDPCWLDLTCLIYHYETQPIPNPLSYYLHQMPAWFHKAGALFNHGVELIVPCFVFWPGRLCRAAGVLIVLFHLMLILSGNLSWLNYLSIALAIACFDDSFLRRVFPARFASRASSLPAYAMTARQKAVLVPLGALIGVLSIAPASNMLARRQMMNASFDSFHLVNTYGAFGTVGKERYEVIIEGTMDPAAAGGWKEYEFICKPGSVDRRPCVIAPLQPRLDWQIWFAAMGSFEQNPWLARLAVQLLEGNAEVRKLLAEDPFDGKAPLFLRANLYRYRFDGNDAWWSRSFAREYFPALGLEHPYMRAFTIPRR